MICEACKRFAALGRACAASVGECDCPKCQGLCACAPEVLFSQMTVERRADGNYELRMPPSVYEALRAKFGDNIDLAILDALLGLASGDATQEPMPPKGEQQ